MVYLCTALYLLAGISTLDYVIRVRNLTEMLINSLLEGDDAEQAHELNHCPGWLWIVLFWPAVFTYNLISDLTRGKE